MSLFSKEGSGVKAIMKQLELEVDFPGCYVVSRRQKPIYVGISRTVIARVIQHVKGRTHFDASLAYRIASDRYAHKMHRKAAMSHPKFRYEFERAKKYLATSQVSFIEIANDIELYLFEVYCAMKLETTKWNTCKTH